MKYSIVIDRISGKFIFYSYVGSRSLQTTLELTFPQSAFTMRALWTAVQLRELDETARYQETVLRFLPQPEESTNLFEVR
jgi:hypothetical protein